MIILDQEQTTMLNADHMMGFMVIPENDHWLIAALANVGGATIKIAAYQTQEMAAAVRQQMMTAFSMGKNVFEMPMDIPPIEIIQDGDNGNAQPLQEIV